MFYRDQQDCVIWILKDGKVVTKKNQLVANSLPEFLSHIDDDSVKWYEISNRYFKKLN